MKTPSFKDVWKMETFAKSAKPRVFEMIRQADESGHSGIGLVLTGIIFPSGQTVICWNPEASKVKLKGKNVNSVTVFDSFEDFQAIHIGQHPTNGTIINYLN